MRCIHISKKTRLWKGEDIKIWEISKSFEVTELSKILIPKFSYFYTANEMENMYLSMIIASCILLYDKTIIR